MSVLSDMDWMLGEAHTFLKGLRDYLPSRQDSGDNSLDDSLYFLQHYLLDISQDVGHLAHSLTDLFAWERPGTVRCHNPLSYSRTLFEESMVTAASSHLQGDISSQTNTKMVERLIAPPVSNQLAK